MDVPAFKTTIDNVSFHSTLILLESRNLYVYYKSDFQTTSQSYGVSSLSQLPISFLGGTHDICCFLKNFRGVFIRVRLLFQPPRHKCCVVGCSMDSFNNAGTSCKKNSSRVIFYFDNVIGTFPLPPQLVVYLATLSVGKYE